MLGWNIGIYRQTDGGASPATWESPKGTRLAIWQTRAFGGLDWIDNFVKADKAIALGGNGYPRLYTLTAENVIPDIINNPPEAREVWGYDAHDILLKNWEGKTVIDHDAVAVCRPDEWLLVEAWDES